MFFLAVTEQLTKLSEGLDLKGNDNRKGKSQEFGRRFGFG
jgi:hypothetical protein